MATLYWVPHEKAVWLPAQKISDGKYKTDQGEVSIADEKSLELVGDNLALEGINDVCLLSSISDAALVHTLRVRYARDEIYTYISCILVSLNPLKPISIYSSDYIQQYRDAHDIAALPPHIFGTSALAFQHLMDRAQSQALLISGESGAGKTENTKFVLLYISEVLRSQAGLADRLLEVNPILESFGNAKTVRNNNSSRFGKWIEVMVQPATMSLAGATVTDYLLEVTRVCSQGPNERNYHVFYQLTTSTAAAEFPMLKLGDDASKFNFLKRNPATVDGMDDKVEFQHLRDAMTALKFSVEEEENILRIVAGLLHLGNVEFEAEGDGSKVKDGQALPDSAEVLMVAVEGLTNASIFKRITTGKEVMMSPLDPQKACQQRDSIAKMIYSRLFKFLVQRCNSVLGEEISIAGSNAGVLFFGVLDIAGFEYFDTNYLEQLFINLSNEKLQQFFNNSVFKTELKEYEDEGIPITKITYQDNVDVLTLIEGKGGLLLMLDDATMGVRQTDLQYTTKLIQAHEKHGKFLKPKFTKDNPLQFGIKHYAGDVMYTALEILNKNVSTQPPEVLELMASSQLPVLKEIAEASETEQKGAAKKSTVSSMFRKSLQTLVEKLNAAEAHFVRCIKTNKEKIPGKFDAPMIVDQLRLSGVMETVKIRKSGYLMRPVCKEFLQRFMVLLEKSTKKQLLQSAGSSKDWFPTKETNMINASKALINNFERLIGPYQEDHIVVGKTKVFIKSELYRNLEEARRTAFIKPSLMIEKVWRGYRTRVIMKEVLEINSALKTLSAESGDITAPGVQLLKRDIARATLVEDKLSMMDALLERAMKLPIKLPSLPIYMKARGSLAAQAKLARELADCEKSVNLPWIQAHVARAASYGMEGPLIDGLKTRCQSLEQQLRERRALQNCVYSEVMEDVQKVIANAESCGLGTAANWLLTDGPDHFKAAVARKEGLIEEQKAKAKAIQDINDDIRSLASKIETTAMQSLLFRSMAFNMRGEIIDALDNFVKAAACLKQFKDGDGEQKSGGGANLEEVQKQVAEAKTSLDLPVMQAILEKAEGAGMSADILQPLRDRCQNLETQSLLRRELQGCALCEDFETVDKVITSAKESHLEEASNWLLDDGHRLMERALSQREELKRIEALKSLITKAASCYDANAMMTSLGEASSLGVSLAQFEGAHQVFLNLQSAAFVEVTSAELREQGGRDPDTLLKISNLADQIAVLGIKVDSAGLSQVAGDIAAGGRSKKRQKSRKSVFDVGNPTEVALAQKVFEDLANYTHLRDPLTWGSTGLPGEAAEADSDPAALRNAMLSHSDEKIPTSMTDLPDDLVQVAVTNFVDVQRCMGDKPSMYKGDKKEPVIENAKKDVKMTDEVYCQVIKQLSCNSSTRSLTAGWELLTALIEETTPSHELGEFLRAFLQAEAKTAEDSTSWSGSSKKPRASINPRGSLRPGTSKAGGRSRGASMCAEAELRTRKATETWEDFANNTQPRMAAQALKKYLTKVIDTL